jgi:tRNA threonylcarbamoyl adenosine modification protein (Sua5/YciO/YrdC/YwlC family)
VVAIDPHRPQWPRIRRVAAIIRQGGVVAIPTDTVYGLAGNPFLPGVAERLFRVKRRPETQPILLLVDSLDRLQDLVCDPPPVFRKLAAAFWPGPLTVILRASARVPEAITAGTGTVAIRWPAAELPRALIRAVGAPLTATSANLSGRRSALTASEVDRQLGGAVDCIVDGGRAPRTRPSTILDLTNEYRIVRRGAVPDSRLLRFLEETAAGASSPAPRRRINRSTDQPINGK